jgi:hypothetical protein
MQLGTKLERQVAIKTLSEELILTAAIGAFGTVLFEMLRWTTIG